MSSTIADAVLEQQPRFRTLHQARSHAEHVRWSRRRPWLVLPYMVFSVLALWVAGYPVWRVQAAAVLCVLLAAPMIFDAARADCGNPTPIHYLTNALVMGGILAVTGGVLSPFTTILLGSQIITAAIFGKGRDSTLSTIVTCAVVAALAVLPTDWRGPPIASPWQEILFAASIIYALLLFGSVGVSQTEATRQAGETLERLREDLLAQSLERTRSLEQVSARVAHELKNPLAAVKALVQLLSSGADDDRTKERLGVIGSEIGRMEKIMTEYMSFSRALIDLSADRVELSQLVDEVLAILEARAEQAGVRLRRAGDPTAVSLTADARRLKEALLNLVSNGIEATPRGGSVEIEIRKTDAGAEIVVEDSGRGIPAEMLAKVGTPYFTTREGGTGLGVVIAKSAIEQHGGDISYASEPGRGTRVTVRLPPEPVPCAGCCPLPGVGERP